SPRRLRRRAADVEAAAAGPAGRPVDAVEQLFRLDPERARDLDQGVDPGDPVAALDQADLGPVQGGADRQFLLRHRRSFARPAQVLTEAPGDFFGLLFVLRHIGSIHYKSFCLTDNRLYPLSESPRMVSLPSVRTDGSQAKPASSSPGLTPSDPISLTSVSVRATRSPRSICPTAVRWSSARIPSSSWVMPARSRQRATLRPKRVAKSKWRPSLSGNPLSTASSSADAADPCEPNRRRAQIRALSGEGRRS